jgi:hypothetical protein
MACFPECRNWQKNAVLEAFANFFWPEVYLLAQNGVKGG